MYQTPQTAVLLIDNPMVREGLKLLLEDMHFIVIPSISYLECEKIIATLSVPPALLIFPQILNNNKPAIDFAMDIRERFNTCIPTILLSSENGIHNSDSDKQNILILPAQSNAKDLRSNIATLLRIKTTIKQS